jgi:hypothetical protein
MHHFLLLGAGFSRNWGGWLASEVFDYLLGSPEILDNPHLRRALWKTKDSGGFEQTLSQLQSDHPLGLAEEERASRGFEQALIRMFTHMNSALLEVNDLEIGTPQRNTIGSLLARFDAIFTLNQDLLLEHIYMPHSPRGSQLPGLKRQPEADGRIADSWVHGLWTDSGQTLPDGNLQPVYKLHGSTNWRTAEGGNLLVLGAAKIQLIQSSRLLNSYAQLLEGSLSQPNARLMVIGYGFGDRHINEILARAGARGMKMFVIDPNGSDLARKLNETRTNDAPIITRTDLEAIFEEYLIGASRRTLREIFDDDVVEQQKLERFFQDL